MSNRAQRRAAMRLTLNQQHQEQKQTAVAAAANEAAPVSEAQLAANRANSLKSTGATTPEGKAKSSMNAVKTGLTGQTVLLPTDDAVAYQAHLDRHFSRLAPATDEEHTLVQFIADSEWRLLRITPLEEAIYAIGRLKFADLYPEEQNAAVRSALIRAEVFLAYRRDLSNLALQEGRLRRRCDSDLAKLKALQDQRREKEEQEAKLAAKAAPAQTASSAPAAAPNGFVFSTPQPATENGFVFSASNDEEPFEEAIPQAA